MKNGIIRVICFAVFAGLTLAAGGCSRKEQPKEAQDLESVKVSLRAQVARGELTREEATVRLAQATKEAKLGSNDKDEVKLPPALEALSKELKERVAKGELTTEEAKTVWREAFEKAKSGAKATPDAGKDKG